jgi:SAM-dependent methyltransferase
VAILSHFSVIDSNMTERVLDMSTDTAWEEWGRRDPYFGVITDPKFRRAALTDQAKQDFFDSGRVHVEYVMQTVRRCIGPNFQPTTVLDFGCGVGRTLIPFAALAHEVVGVDVSPSMLQEARRNFDAHQLKNIRLLESDDALSSLTGVFDLIHSSIVFQHIPIQRGRILFRNLLAHVAPGGIGAFHFLYSNSHYYLDAHGITPSALRSPPVVTTPPSGDADPEIQMNPYNVNELLFLMHCRGVHQLHADFTDHGGELGLFVFFQAPI